MWIEHILSDEGALGYLQGGAMPARFQELVKADKISAADMENLPAADLIAQVKFLTQEQITKANQALTDNWDKMVLQA